MNAVGRIGSYISQGVYTVSGPFHPFGGAVDIIAVEQPDGSFKSSPWYVRFGKFQGVLKAKEKVVNIRVNGVEANFHMYLDHKGEAYFLKEADEKKEGESVLYPSSSGDETDGQSNGSRRPMKSNTCNFDADKSNSADRIAVSNGMIVARTSSRRSRILGLVFGRRSIKEDSYREGKDSAGIVRVSSLESAEIAADLLEVKWSTNLLSGRRKKDNSSRFSAPVMLDGMGDKDLQNSDESQVGSSVQDDVENSVANCMLHDKTGSSNEQTGNSSMSGPKNVDCFAEEASVEMSCISTAEQVVETSTLGERGLEEKCVVISELSKNTDECSLESANHNDNAKGVISEITAPDSQIPIDDEVCPSEQFDEEKACSERVNEESKLDRVQSFIYCETSESSIVGLDGSSEQACETMYLASGGRGEVHVLAENLHATTELLCEDTVMEQAEDVELETRHVEVSENNSQQTNPSPSFIHDYNKVDLKVPVTVSDSYTHIVGIDPTLGSVEEVKSQSICAISCFSDSGPVEDEKNNRNDLQPSLKCAGDSQKFDSDYVPTKAESILSSESSEEEQFLFSDLDEFKFREVQHMESISPDCIIKDNHHSFTLESIKELNGSVNANDESYSPPDNFVQDNPSTDLENSIEKSGVISTSINIPSSHRVDSEEVGWLGGSLPNMWPHVHNLDADGLGHPLSHSLDSNSKSSKWTLLGKDKLRCKKSDADKGSQLVLEQPNNEDTQISGELKSVVVNPAIEISLCKHLLYEGMGADAASQAFDANKLDIDKFMFLGPTVVKNDKLVVKFGGHYFPWDAAAPIILGMVTFGCQEILKSKAMIAVDQVEKSFEGDTSKIIVSPGGSWGLWPFSFKRSRSGKAMQPAPGDARSSDAENALESTIGTVGDKNVLQSKVVRKMVRAKKPTSEQLASLNLKEGGNTITFTFSTAMLGKQQVDARIYLWKWNSRIVISDVDGTITRSDVLGQFMPLVGVDWSQTGVAHLFSSIKENGYHLLFLSARAISQAYHTRQFLVNLKQDGKALPDGPVVISPDGLFPSLYREVIRRAPHEFKIACLEDIRALYPSDCNPFYAGFGNRDTDEISYLKVGIPKGKIFIINPKGQVAVNRRVDTKSYNSLHDLVHDMFPPMTSSEQEDFNSWNYWKLSPPVIDI